jgi:hypothetical protein
MMRELTRRFISLRRSHPGWLLLASPKGPLILSSLKTMMEANPGGIGFEEAVEHLAAVFADHSNDTEFELNEDFALTARRELRQWLKRGLIVERNGQILATDSLQRSIQFIDSLEDSSMTSTASRLATVQRAIESLDTQLSRSQAAREELLRAKIAALTAELDHVQQGKFTVLEGSRAEEGICEVYLLAVSLLSDFRRVEDSYREADQTLRQRIISENQNRGEIVDELLNGHESLIHTPEGQVFESFYSQLVQSVELEQMKARLRSILENSNSDQALQRKQKTDLRQLVSRLLQESERVIQARARSERDVRGFLKSGIADEQLRVGAVLQDVFQVALSVDWTSQKVRRLPGPFSPVGISIFNLSLIERLLVKQIGQDTSADLELAVSEADPTQLDEEFWQAYRALNRKQLFESTLARLRATGQPLTIGELAKALPPTHDLETLAYWLAMAREAGLPLDERVETVDLLGVDQTWTRFHVPSVELDQKSIEALNSESLE